MTPQREKEIRETVKNCLEFSRDYKILRPWASLAGELLAEIESLRESLLRFGDCMCFTDESMDRRDIRKIKRIKKNARTENPINPDPKSGSLRGSK